MGSNLDTMPDADEQHLALLISEFEERVSPKYRKGKIEHGGNLWEKDGLLDMALEEVEDLWVYLFTKKLQEDGVYKIKPGVKDND